MRQRGPLASRPPPACPEPRPVATLSLPNAHGDAGRRRSKPDDVIDLGGPPRLVLRRRPAAAYRPNPRLYPPAPPPPPPRRARRLPRAPRRKRPSARLYPPPPARRARAPWPPAGAPRVWPAPAAAGRGPLHSASSAALCLVARRGARADGAAPPGRFLPEFLAAVMRREYVEAFKYCCLILQSDPRDATARGFYPLLQHKLAAGCTEDGSDPGPPARPASLTDLNIECFPPPAQRRRCPAAAPSSPRPSHVRDLGRCAGCALAWRPR